jgi:hypothetical protein
VLLVTARFGP